MNDDDAYVDWEDEPNPKLNQVTNLIIGACIEVHRQLGPGYLEAYYEEALARNLHRAGFDLHGNMRSLFHTKAASLAKGDWIFSSRIS